MVKNYNRRVNIKYNREQINDEVEFTDNINEAMWITPENELIWGEYDMGVRGTDHRALLDLYDLEREDESAWDKVHEIGFIRVVPETKKALIYENQPLTDTQEIMVDSAGFDFENYGEFQLEEINSLEVVKDTMKNYQATTEQLQSSLENINDDDSLKHTEQRSIGRPFNEHENKIFNDPVEHGQDKNRVLNDLNKFQTALNNLTDDEITDINKSNAVIKETQNQMVDKGFDYFYVMPDLSSENPTATAFDDKLTVDVSLSYEDINSLNSNESTIDDFNELVDDPSLAEQGMTKGQGRKLKGLMDKRNERVEKDDIKTLKIGDMSFDYQNMKSDNLEDFSVLKDTDNLSVEFNDGDTVDLYKNTKDKQTFNKSYKTRDNNEKSTVEDYIDFGLNKDEQQVEQTKQNDKQKNKKNDIEL